MNTPPNPAATLSRVVNHADKLFESLEESAAAGGLRRLTAEMRPVSKAKVADLLRSVRASIDEQLAGLKHPVRKAPPTLLRRQANKSAGFKTVQ
jgi:hypothetical protein